MHLLNYDYDGSADAVRPKRNLTVKIRLAQGTKSAGPVMLASPDAPGPDRPCPSRVAGGCLEIELPELKVWSVLYTDD